MRAPRLKPLNLGTHLLLALHFTAPIDAAPTSSSKQGLPRNKAWCFSDPKADNWDVRINTGENGDCTGLDAISERLPQLGQHRATQWWCSTLGSDAGASSLTFDAPEKDLGEVNEALQSAYPDIMFGDDGLCVPKHCNKDFDLDRIGIKDMKCAEAAAAKARASKSARSISRTRRSLSNDTASGTARCELFEDLWDVYVNGGFNSTTCDSLQRLVGEKLPKYDKKSVTCSPGSSPDNGELTLPVTEPQNAKIMNDVLKQVFSNISFGNDGLCAPRICYEDLKRGVKNMTCVLDPPPANNTSTAAPPYGHNRVSLPLQPNIAVCTIQDHTKFEPDYPKLDVDPRVIYNVGIGTTFSEDRCSDIIKRINDEVSGYVVDCNKAFIGPDADNMDDKITELMVKVYPNGLSTLQNIMQQSFPEANFSGNGTCGPDECYYVNGTYVERYSGRKAAIKVKNETCIAGLPSTVNSTVQSNATDTTSANGTTAQSTPAATSISLPIKRSDVLQPPDSGNKTLAPLPDKHIQPNTAICFKDTQSGDYGVVVGTPYSETECSRVREVLQKETESSFLGFSCMDSIPGFTAYFEGEAITKLAFDNAMGQYDVINGRLRTAYPDIKFEGAGLCTYRDCYMPTSEPNLSVLNITCSIEMGPDPMNPTAVSPHANNTSTAVAESSANRTLAPLPPKHVDVNTALCLGNINRDGYYIVIGKDYDQVDCEKVEDVLNCVGPDPMHVWEVNCSGHENMIPAYFTVQPVTKISVGKVEGWEHVVLNDRMKVAFPDVRFEGLGACVQQTCYLGTSDETIRVRNITCGAGTEMLAPTNTTSLPSQNSTSPLAPLPDKHLKANASICWSEGADPGRYRITLAIPFSVESCEKALETIGSHVPKEAMMHAAAPKCEEPGSDDYFKDQKGNITVLTTSVEDKYVGTLNDGLHKAYPDVMFGDMGLCAAYDCYQNTTDPRVKVKNMTCAQKSVQKRTHVQLLPIETNATAVPAASRTTSSNMQKRDLAPLPDGRLEPNHAICYTAGRFEHTYEIVIAKSYSNEACTKVRSQVEHIPDARNIYGPRCEEAGSMGSGYFTKYTPHSEPLIVLSFGMADEDGNKIKLLNEAIQQAFPDVTFGDTGLCTVWGCYDQTLNDSINSKNMTCARDVSLARETKNDRGIAYEQRQRSASASGSTSLTSSISTAAASASPLKPTSAATGTSTVTSQSSPSTTNITTTTTIDTTVTVPNPGATSETPSSASAPAPSSSESISGLVVSATPSPNSPIMSGTTTTSAASTVLTSGSSSETPPSASAPTPSSSESTSASAASSTPSQSSPSGAETTTTPAPSDGSSVTSTVPAESSSVVQTTSAPTSSTTTLPTDSASVAQTTSVPTSSTTTSSGLAFACHSCYIT